MLEFYNLKEKKFTTFQLIESDIRVTEYLESYFYNLEAILSYITLNKQTQEYNDIKKITKDEIGQVLMLLFNSSFNSIKEKAFDSLEFDNKRFASDFNDIFLGFTKEDIFLSIVDITYQQIQPLIKNNSKPLSIYDLIKI